MILQMESAVTAAVSGHVKRVVVQEGTSHLTSIQSSQFIFLFQGIPSTKEIWLSKLFIDWGVRSLELSHEKKMTE